MTVFESTARVAVAILAVLLGQGCSVVYEYPKASTEDSKETCSDGIDNDLDGRADCYDSGCAAFCQEITQSLCSDGIDNDGNGRADCRDANCQPFCREDTAALCRDGIDNDANGRADCRDAACSTFCQENTDAACHDGADNDDDGKTDCADAKCSSFCQEDTEATCRDGRDDDQDGKSDCRDDGCKAFCPEAGAITCGDNIDNDFDGLVDCQDADCDGFCPEQTPKDCSDGRDNDGDGLVDGADALCWPFFAPVAERCGGTTAIDFAERFEDYDVSGPPYYPARWVEFGSYTAADGTAKPIVHHNYWSHETPSGRQDDTAYFSFNTSNGKSLGNNLGGMYSRRTFGGAWDALGLSFATVVPSNSLVRVGLVPLDLAAGAAPRFGAESALVSVAIDRSTNPPAFVLNVGGSRFSAAFLPPKACGLTLCDGGWTLVTVGLQGGRLVAKLSGAGRETTIIGPIPPSAVIHESRLVVWGGSITEAPDSNGDASAPEIDDVRLAIGASDPCGLDAPQIPFSSCDATASIASIGQTTSVARSAAGDYCALLSASLDKASAVPDAVVAWGSADGMAWAPVARPPMLGLPQGVSPIGAAIAHDGKQFVTVVSYREKDGARLVFGSGDTCATLANVGMGPLLPLDAEAPSYVVAAGRHQIYFTRPATDQTARTLWRASGPSAAAVVVESQPLAELPLDAEVSDPVSLTRVGASDLVVTYRTQATSGVSGLGVLVGDENGRSFQRLDPVPFLTGSGLWGFDDAGVTSAALSAGPQGGFFLYGGQHDKRVAVGTAKLRPFGADTVVAATAVATCGNGKCDGKETCDTCPGDCPCSGVSLLVDALADDTRWSVVSNETFKPRRGTYIDSESKTLTYAGTLDQTWSVLSLARSLVGDFDLSFDLVVYVADATARCDPLLVGLGASPDASSYDPAGVFARISYFNGCQSDTYLVSPYARVGGASFATMPWFMYGQCDSEGLELPIEARRRVVLSRQNGTVSTVVYDEHGCPATMTTTYAGALPELSNLLVGSGHTNPAASSFNDCSGVSVDVSNIALRLPSDPARCGASERVCGSGMQEPTCVDTSSSTEHCGACDVTCGDQHVCSSSTCRCASGLTECAKQCVDTTTSLTNCGGCGVVCKAFCMVGACDIGESCVAPRALPSASGKYRIDLTGRTQDIASLSSYDNDVAFTWQAARSGAATIEAEPLSSAYLTLRVTSDPTCAKLDYSSSTPDRTEMLSFNAVAGTTYYVLVALSSGTAGPVDLTIEAP